MIAPRAHTSTFTPPSRPLLTWAEWHAKVNVVLRYVRSDDPEFTRERAERAVAKIYGPCP